MTQSISITIILILEAPIKDEGIASVREKSKKDKINQGQVYHCACAVAWLRGFRERGPEAMDD